MQLHLNSRAKPSVPTVKANKLLQHRRGKREEGEAPVSKHQTQLGCVRWASLREEGKPNPPRETKNSGATGGRNWRTGFCVFLLLSLELGRCSSDLFLSSRPRTGLATTCVTGYMVEALSVNVKKTTTV